MTAHRIVVLWSVPRSVSTSFERMMSERGDFTVFDEPFSRSFYFGPDRRSERYDDPPDVSAHDIVRELERAAEDRPVFVKDMAYQAASLLGPDLLRRFDNCFLVRDPAATLRSLAKRWPDFTDEEGGWLHLDEADSIVEDLGRPRVVLDADLLCDDPAGVIAHWCEEMDLPFVEEALSWEPGLRPEWDLWSDWHGSTSRSTGFTPLRPAPPPPGSDEPRLREAYEQARPIYERLASYALRGRVDA